MATINIINPHLQNAFDGFEERCMEIERFLDFVDDLDKGSANQILNKADNNIWQTKPISREVQKTLRASCYLLIYNLLESTTSEALDSIHLTLTSEQRDLQELSTNLKKIIFNNLKGGLGEDGIKKIIDDQIDIRLSIINHGYSKKNFLSGNFDIDAIKKIEKKYGFELHVVGGVDGVYDKEIIKSIKLKRNALAHGSQSFEQCGQGIPLFSMRSIFKNAKNTLLALINGLNNFLNQKNYLHSH